MLENKKYDWLSNLVKNLWKSVSKLEKKKILDFEILESAVMEAAIFVSDWRHVWNNVLLLFNCKCVHLHKNWQLIHISRIFVSTGDFYLCLKKLKYLIIFFFWMATYMLRVLQNTLRKHAYSNILKFLTSKNEKFQIKKTFDIFHISAQNLDCGYSLEPPRRGGSNEYPQSRFLCKIKKNNVYPCKPQFYYIKVGFKGVKII